MICLRYTALLIHEHVKGCGSHVVALPIDFSLMLDDGVCQGSPRVGNVSCRTHVLGVSKRPIKDLSVQGMGLQPTITVNGGTNKWMDK